MTRLTYIVRPCTRKDTACMAPSNELSTSLNSRRNARQFWGIVYSHNRMKSLSPRWSWHLGTLNGNSVGLLLGLCHSHDVQSEQRE